LSRQAIAERAARKTISFLPAALGLAALNENDNGLAAAKAKTGYLEIAAATVGRENAKKAPYTRI
jgi:hypothetical protein